MLEDLEGGDINKLYVFAKQIVEEAKKRPELTRVMTSFKTNYPQFYIDLDRTKAMTLGVTISDIFATIQANLGSLYVNDFNKYGKIYRVFVQAKEDSRIDKTDISRLYVRSNAGQMVPLSALVQVNEIKGVQTVSHYNLYRAIEIDGSAAPGYSSGQAIKAMEEIADSILPEGYSYEWTGIAYQEIKAGALAGLVFLLAIVFVFLFLSAQYESFTMPFMIMLAVPLAMLGALSFQWARGLSNDVYCQIGLVTLIGLASKNAILIVEFAKNKRNEGHEIVDSALTAIRIRLRPILMTAFAFILGVFPLVIAEGAGAASRHSLGTAVFGGMIVSTFLSIGIVPVLYVVIENIREKGFKKAFKGDKISS
jgi:multidrug efflux pump subunit AcrB